MIWKKSFSEKKKAEFIDQKNTGEGQTLLSPAKFQQE